MLATLELAILALVPWPALRLLSIPQVRREYTGFAWSLVVALSAYTCVVLGIAVLLPLLLHPCAVLAAVVLLVERWRARPAYGMRRGLPPGSLGVFPRGPWVDESFYRGQAARYGPVFKTSLQYRPCACILGARLGTKLLQAHDNDLEAPKVRFNRFIPKGFLRYMEPGDHRVYKRPFRVAFSSNVFDRNEPVMREIVRRGAAELVRESAVQRGRGINPRAILRETIFELLAASFFGLGADSDDLSWLRARYEELELRKVSLIPENRDRDALAAIEEWVRSRGRALQERSEGGDAPQPCFLKSLAETLPEALEDETALGNLVYSLTIARADLTALSMWILKMLADAPEWAERLRDVARSQPDADAHALAWAIVRETLRLEQSEYVYRRVKRDIDFEGFTIPRDWRIRILIREGHRDAALFPDPDRFDPGRWLGSHAPGAHFQPFGLGAHACIGAPVTEAVSCLLLTELASATDWRMVSDGPREYGWAHWQPSSKLRLTFIPAA